MGLVREAFERDGVFEEIAKTTLAVQRKRGNDYYAGVVIAAADSAREAIAKPGSTDNDVLMAIESAFFRFKT